VVLVLGLLAAVPMVADTADVEIEKEAIPMSFDFSEPLFTPMEGAQEQGVITVEDLRRIHFLEECGSAEQWAQCPGCQYCIVSGYNIYCGGC
jgi:hypothetical protein